MATYSLANERLRALEEIEREIGAILQNAGSGSEARTAGGEGQPGTRRAVGAGPWAGQLSSLGLTPLSPGPGRNSDPGTVQGKNQ